MPKAKNPDPDLFYLEGNRGGSYLLIRKKGNEEIYLRLGHDCVVRFDSVISVEKLAGILSEYFDQQER